MKTDESITIDLSYLQSVTGGDRVFEKTLLEGAVNDIQLKIDNLQKAWDEQDASSVKSNAHSLKSLTAIVGLPQIERLSKVIEQMFSDGIFHKRISESYKGILTGWLKAKPKLKHMISTY
jgi:HPt (histidine-containing phosphotransfer) domain-containing protein